MSDVALPVSVTLATELSIDQFAAILKKNCRTPASAEVIAHDPQRLPKLWIYDLAFATPDERDRLLIALRQREPASATPAAAKQPQRRRA
ncbi:MAG: hypothetical protein JNM81_03075 [Rhodospirillaceae bacterium]|nr:hypothetical protein [Rhodospirillaceae bacterium]